METTTLTNEKILKIAETLKVLGDLEFDEKMYENEKESRKNWQKFAYAVSRNEDKFASLAKAIRKALEPSKEFKDYNQKRLDLNKEYADRDEKGDPKIFRGEYLVTENRNGYDVALAKLKDEYDEVLKKREDFIDGIDEFMSKEEEVEFYEIQKAYLPLTLKPSELSAMFPLMDEEV